MDILGADRPQLKRPKLQHLKPERAGESERGPEKEKFAPKPSSFSTPERVFQKRPRNSASSWVRKKANTQRNALKTELESKQQDLENLKNQRREESRKIAASELLEEERFQVLNNRSKHFVNTLKIVAYRAETALAQILAETMHAHHRDEASGLAQPKAPVFGPYQPTDLKSVTVIPHPS